MPPGLLPLNLTLKRLLSLWWRSGDNFINIKCKKILYEHHFSSFYYAHITREKLPKQQLYEKFVHLTMMKLTPERHIDDGRTTQSDGNFEPRSDWERDAVRTLGPTPLSWTCVECKFEENVWRWKTRPVSDLIHDSSIQSKSFKVTD